MTEGWDDVTGIRIETLSVEGEKVSEMILRKKVHDVAKTSDGTAMPDETLVILQPFRESIGYGLALLGRIRLPLMHHIDCFRL